MLYDMHVLDIASVVVKMLIDYAPKDKLGLVNSISLTIYDDDHIEIEVTAPYTDYTNKYWQIDLQNYRNGKKRSEYNKKSLKSYMTGGVNPNLGWFDTALTQAGKLIAEFYEGWMVTNV
jgi:hypothetical protein